MKALAAMLGLALAGCGGRILLVPDDGGLASDADASDDGASDASDAASLNQGRGPAPIPSCVADLSQCVQMATSIAWVGVAVVRCAPASFMGPWNLLLEREINNNQYTVVQRQSVGMPGFGTVFEDTSSNAPQLSYRVCVVDELGTRCGDPFTAQGPPDCVCVPLTCARLQACNSVGSDGCGGKLICGACADGTTCNAYQSCCPPDMESDGVGPCVCAPPKPCPRGTEWDVLHCQCLSING